MFKVGDSVSVIHENIKGKITNVNGQRVSIEDDHGFPRHFLAKELAPYKTEKHYKLTDEQIEKVINEQLDYQKITLKTKQGVGAVHHYQESFEIDLHIEELVDNIDYLTEDTLSIQMRYCRMFIERAIRLKVKKALLIHGKGAGVLRTEIHKYLERQESIKHIRIDYKVINNGGATEVYL